MPMKVSLALGPRRTLSRQTAWGCLTTNLTMPGFGSLVAGRVSGYGQVVLTICGMVLSMVFGARFIVWYFTNWSRVRGDEMDPMSALGEMWVHVRWALLGIVIFAFAWIWALGTSFLIVRSARQAEAARVPPRLM